MNNWIIHKIANLARPGWLDTVTDFGHCFVGDANAHTWKVDCVINDEPADLSGYTVRGYFIRGDQQTVIIQGTVEGNTAVCVLSAHCYVVEGLLRGILRLEKAATNENITIGAMAVRLSAGSTDSIVDTSDSIPSLAELLDEIQNMRDATDAAETATEDALAAIRMVDERLATFDAVTTQLFPKVAGQGAVITGAGTISAPLPAFVLYGKSVQDGTPSPEDPADIATAGSAGSVGIVCAGKNFAPYPYSQSSVTADGVAFTARSDGSVRVQGTATGNAATYVMKGNAAVRAALVVGQRYKVTSYDSGNDHGPYDDCWFQVYAADGGVDGQGYDTFTWRGSNDCNMGIRVRNGATVDTVVYPMIRLASVADAGYEPYVGIVATLPTPNGLPGIPVTGGGNYTDAGGQQWICDTIDKAAGVYTQRVGRIVLDGTQTYYPTGTLTGGAAFYVDLNALVHVQSYSDMIMCDALVPVDNHNNVKFTLNRISGYKDNGSYPNANWLYFSLTGVTNASEAAAWLAEHPITVLYVLATPVTTALTAAQIAALDGLRSHEGETAIYTTDAVGPEMAAKLCIDIPTYIDSLLN